MGVAEVNAYTPLFLWSRGLRRSCYGLVSWRTELICFFVSLFWTSDRTRDSSLLQSVQTTPGYHKPSHAVGTDGPVCANDQLFPSSVEVETGRTYSSILPSAFKTRIGTNSLPICFRTKCYLQHLRMSCVNGKREFVHSQAVKAHGGVASLVRSHLTSALDGRWWSDSRSGCYNSGQRATVK